MACMLPSRDTRLTHLVVRARLSERVDGHADARGGEDVEVDLEARERLEEVEGRALVGALVRRHLLELLADPHHLVLHRRRHDGDVSGEAVGVTQDEDGEDVEAEAARRERDCCASEIWLGCLAALAVAVLAPPNPH